MAALVGFGVCGLLALWAPGVERRSESTHVPAVRLPLEISLDETVHLIRPSTTPAVRPQLPGSRRRTVPHAMSGSAAHAAQAATLVARESAAPVDLTGETFVVGSARAYGGGLTSPHGTSAVAVQATGAAGRSVSAEGAGVLARSAPVGLATRSWSCPWPTEADPLPIDEETVVIRVVVRPDGSAETVAVVSDPGHGFGDAAATCAMRTTFTPALAPDGEPVRGTSAPITVRFTR